MRRVRVVECTNHYAAHEGTVGWELQGDYISVAPGNFFVELDGPIDHVFGGSGLYCVAWKVEPIEEAATVTEGA